jgi:hypothetical protein
MPISFLGILTILSQRPKRKKKEKGKRIKTLFVTLPDPTLLINL